MTYTLNVHTTTYRPWEDGADERPKIAEDSSVEEFERLNEVAGWLRRHGLQSPSAGLYTLHTWLSEVDPYEHPYRGTREDVTAHPRDGFTDRTWSAVIRSVRWPAH